MAYQQEIALNFTGGLNDSLDPDRIGQDELADVLNMRANPTGNAVSRDGLSEEVELDATAFPDGLSSIYEATLADGTTRTIATAWVSSDVKFYYKNGSAWTELSTSANLDTEIAANGDGKLWRWVFFNNLFIGVKRGGFKPVKWDGATVNAVDLLNTESATSGLCDGTARPIDVAVWNRRLAFIQGTELFVSDAAQAEEWDSGDSFVTDFAGSNNGEEVCNALGVFQGDLIVFKKDAEIWEVRPGTGVSNSFEIKQIGWGVGCSSPLSIANLGRDLIWFHRNGFNTLSDLRDTGGKLPNGQISQKIWRTLCSQVNQTYLEYIVGVYNPTLEEYMCAVPSTLLSTENDKVLVLNTFWTQQRRNPSWWVYEYNYNLKYLAIRANQGLYPVYASDYDGGLYRLNTGSTDNNVSYAKMLKTRRFPLGTPQTVKSLHDFFVDLYQGSSYDVTIQVILDQGRRTKSFTADVVAGSALWDTAEWDDAEWASALFGLVKKYIGMASRDVQFYVYTDEDSDILSVNKMIQEYETDETDLQTELSR